MITITSIPNREKTSFFKKMEEEKETEFHGNAFCEKSLQTMEVITEQTQLSFCEIGNHQIYKKRKRKNKHTKKNKKKKLLQNQIKNTEKIKLKKGRMWK